jgi:hypothetical protein
MTRLRIHADSLIDGYGERAVTGQAVDVSVRLCSQRRSLATAIQEMLPGCTLLPG